MPNMNVSDLLAHNIRLMREEDGFMESEKASIADALYGISMARANLEDETDILDKLDTANEVIMSYLFHLDILVKE